MKNQAFKATGGQRASIADGILSLSACIPDACKPSEVFGPFGMDLSCVTKDETKRLDNGDIAFLYGTNAFNTKLTTI